MPIPHAAYAKSVSTYPQLVRSIQGEFQLAQKEIRRIKATAYWRVGRYISQYLLKNKKRAVYGDRFFVQLADDLEVGERILQDAVKFHRSFPIPHARAEFNWTQYRKLLGVPDLRARQQLFRKIKGQGLTTRALEWEIKALKKKEFAPSGGRLSVIKGKLHTYRLDKPKNLKTIAGYRSVDCGFGIWRQVPAEGLGKLSENTIVEAHTSETWFKLIKTARTQDDLYTYRAALDYVIDGDTVVLEIDVGFRTFSRQKLRLRGIDTPEIATPQGQKAKAFVQGQFKKAKGITVKTYRRDKYDRFLADVFVRTAAGEIFLNQKLLDKNLATLYI